MSSEERMQVLRMIESGNVSAAEGSKLLEAMGARPPVAAAPASGPGRWLRVRVQGAGSETVNVNIPLQLAEFAVRFIPKDVMARFGDDLDPATILAAVQALGDAGGKIVEVNSADGSHVEIFVE
ncbi:MAG TPA: hypothetical protein VNM16_13460 [Bacillota bacterium]|nr:hypothetical protein [Bacillota bacterium]